MARGRKKKEKTVDIIEKPTRAEEVVLNSTPKVDPLPLPSVDPGPKEVRYYLAKGKSVTSQAGIIDEKESRRRGGIDASYFIGGKQTLENLVANGVLVVE